MLSKKIYLFSAIIFTVTFIISCGSGHEVHEGWTGYDKEPGKLSGFQTNGTMDICSITLKGDAAAYIENVKDTLTEKMQYFIQAEGDLIMDDDFELPDGKFIVYKILFPGDIHDFK